MKLENVDIGALRGIPGGWPTLPIGEKGLVIYGPNGVGKSSIIDALEATISGRSTLFADERIGVSWEAAAPHVKGGKSSVVIKGKVNGKPVELALGKPPADNIATWVKTGQTASYVLRRYMLLRFVDAQPKKRYEQIEPFLNLGAFSAFETGLKEVAREAETKLATIDNELATKAQIIRQIFNLAENMPIDRSDLIQRLQQRLSDAGFKADDDATNDLDTLASILNIELGGHDTNQKLDNLRSAKHHAQKLTALSLLLPLHENVLSAASELAEVLHASAQKIPMELLTGALDYVTANSPDICPICEQVVQGEQLKARLEERLRDLESVKSATKTLEARLSALKEAVTATRLAYITLIRSWDGLGLDPLPDSYMSAVEMLTRLESLSAKTVGESAAEIKALMEASDGDPNAIIATLDEAIRMVGGGERRAKLVEAASYLSAIQGDVAAYVETLNKRLVLAEQSVAAEKLLGHAEAARKAAVQNIADSVAGIANSLYEEIHPGEGIATSKLTVREAASGSIILRSSFHGQEAQPLLYYSESHLDTLGLCYFLAIRKLEVATAPHFKLLLVDDVLHSVDAEHRGRLAKLLKDHFADHQMILVTHDKHFYDRLRAVLGGDYKYLAITNWDIDAGPRLSDPSTDLDRVTDPAARQGKSAEELAAAGGRFFEWMLKGLTERLQVAIQARFRREHDIGSMWPPLASKLTKHKAFTTAHPHLVNDLNENTWVRNKIGAHDNENESSITPKEVNGFVDGLAALYRATTCQSCETMIQKNIQSDVWRCECSKLQYDA